MSNLAREATQFHVVPWWLHLGEAIYGDLLVISERASALCEAVSQFASRVDSVSFADCTSAMQQRRKAPCICVANGKYNGIIIVSPCKHVDNKLLEFVYKNLLLKNASILLLERNDCHLYRLKYDFFPVLQNFFIHKRQGEIQSRCPNARILHMPTTTYDEGIHESFCFGYYHSNKNRFVFKERVKRLLFNTSFARLLNNCNIWSVRNSHTRATLIEMIHSSIAQIEGNKQSVRWHWSNTLYKNGKLVFTFVNAASPDDARIVVVALSKKAIAQRDNEARCVSSLASSASLKTLIPQNYRKLSINGLNCYFMKKCRGVTVDVDHKKLELMTSNVVNLLHEIGRETIHERNTTGPQVQLVTCAMAGLRRRLAGYDQEFDKIQDHLLEMVSRHIIPMMLLHGDAKLENFVLDEYWKVCGIIDWELGVVEGVPLLDLLYLIAYNRDVVELEPFGRFYCDLIDEQLKSGEQRWIDVYCEEFAIGGNVRKVLYLLFFVHHFGIRLHIDVTKSDLVDDFEVCLSKVISTIPIK